MPVSESEIYFQHLKFYRVLDSFYLANTFDISLPTEPGGIDVGYYKLNARTHRVICLLLLTP